MIQEKETKKSRKKLVVTVIIATAVILLFIAYMAVAVYFRTHFLPNTQMNGIDCSNQDAAATAELLEKQIAGFSLDIVGRTGKGEKRSLGTIQASDIDLAYLDMTESIENCLAGQNFWLWPKAFLTKEYSVPSEWDGKVAFDEEKLKRLLQDWVVGKTNVEKPEDAYISEYLEEKKGYQIIPEKIGNQLDIAVAEAAVRAAIEENAGMVDLEEQACYVLPKVTAQDQELLNTLESMNQWVGAQITYDWNGSKVTVEAEQIQDWIVLKGTEAALKKDAIAEFVKENAEKYDTYGKNRKFLTTLGVELTLPGGAYGWKTDIEGETKELIAAIQNGGQLEKEPLYISKGAKKGSNDIGSSYVEADMTNQHLYLYQKGTIVLETDFVSGDMATGCTTPPGVFGITYKTMNAVLRGADYVTPVTYWMPFNGNVGMHDATWRTEFGGDIYLQSGSHGCLNLPLDKAEAIYGYMREGFPVICYYYAESDIIPENQDMQEESDE